MFERTTLEGRRVAVLAADGFEKIELTLPLKALQAKGAQVDIISLRPGSIRGVNLQEPASRIKVTRTLDEADPADYDALLIPGGFMSPDLLRQSAAARDFVRAFDAARKPIASICHGPWLLASAGLTQGRTMTSWPGVRDDMVNAGATWLDQEVVRDGNWVTSRGPQDMRPFVKSMTALFTEQAPVIKSTAYSLFSDPQRQSPPALVTTAMRLLPKPSLRTLVGVAVVGAGIMAATRRKPGPSAPQ
ncbi:MAG TPA: type 1 glutamine amidotransferase domain-containing protein [Noviherbaspirillum sp.]|uniref:type 1 glutamine amidotransferase domain-containing protein n=1 Tax=Noviherbaspirillum sp. TaxID=1926288 RepID=UPI002D36BB0F|nr:type 1 glutamine amidotransferase domain-containing protein [Noviherbaspirillum sp.]HYD96799.1 type 1 glutamine amidotransferase domain-containing protein [Noviherbaspirillum sp.]